MDIAHFGRSMYQFRIIILGFAVLAASGRTLAHGQSTNELTRHENKVSGIRDLLVSGVPPSLGVSRAPVEIVEFADFECSFCKQLSDMLENHLMPVEKDHVRLVYRYLPLPQHPWARAAAEMAACVGLQGNRAFWTLHDFLYAKQDQFSMITIQPEVTHFLGTQAGIDMKSFVTCVDQRASAAIVDADMKMAAELDVHSTPTLFVNGERLHGVHDLKQLEDAVTTALENQDPIK